ELLVYVQDTFSNAIKLNEKKLLSHPKIRSRKLGLKCSTSNCGSKPIGNKKNDKISRTPSRNMKNKVEAQPRKVNKKNRVDEPIRDVVQIILWYMDSECSKHMTGNRSQLMNFISKFLGTVGFGNDHIARIIGYGDYKLGNVTISRVYCIKGLGHNLFYSWLWHRRLSHLNFGTLNKLDKDDLARGTPRLKFQKDHLCSACALGKSKKSSPQPKAKDTNQEKLYLLHMNLCGPMRAGKESVQFYNKRTHKIIETIHVTFDELTSMDSEQLGSRLGLQYMTPATSSSGLVPNTVSQQPCIPPNRDDWDHLFQPMFDEYFNPPIIAVSPVTIIAAPRAIDLADSPVFTSIDQDTPSTSIPSTQEQEQEQEHSPTISQDFEESPKTPTFRADPLDESLHEDSNSQGTSSNVRQIHTLFEHLGKWTKDHPIANVIRDPSRSVSTIKQLQTDAMWCYFDAFLTSVEPKNFKQAMTKPSWIDAMQEEFHEFERL
nr:integrase, catalytic region, zinc finger, CCHC-type, peptidase aspartic, catalytic [Tanacetum cinerariifolium]